jgi:hypothetical protein
MIPLTICAIIVVPSLILFVYWRTPWDRVKSSRSTLEAWYQHDLNFVGGLPSPILEATFESCKINSQGDLFYFEINGVKPIEISLNNSSSHWLKSSTVPEMMAMYGLKYAACCLKEFLETADDRWLNKFDRALDIAEVEARRGLKTTFYPWTEHVVALRMVSSRYCLYAIARSSKQGGVGGAMALRYERVLNIHLTAAKICMEPMFYDFITNHGLITDNSLMQCALTWPANFLLLEKVLKEVSRRVDSAAVYFISPDGVPLEPATSYWYLIRRMFNDIKISLEVKNQKPSQIFLSRLQALDEFLVATNMNGKIQRFGDSACGNHMELPFIAPARSDGIFLRVYDTGFILMNVVQDSEVVAQFMVNAQDIYPRVHAQEDDGAIALYARETFWINSPGSYTAMNLAKRKMYTCYSNQSTVWHHSGYQSGCKILSVITEEKNFVISLVVGQKVERKIYISKSGFNIKIIDKTTDNTELTVGILLNPSCIIINDENGFKLQEKEKILTISSFTRGTESRGFINYRSNEVIETKSLRRTGPEVHTKIHLPEFDNLNVHFFGSCPAVPKYFRSLPNAGFLNYFARNLSIKKIKLILVLSLSLVIPGLLVKLIKN